MSTDQRRYVSYLLRLWETITGGQSVWRASLESPHTHDRVGFASLEALFAFLQQRTAVVSDSYGDKGELVERSERRGR